jgi:hypothetical protein
MNDAYRAQVSLLVACLPHFARENYFAIKGGTAINLFDRDMPRLSVDIDLAYTGFEAREEASQLIDAALGRIIDSLEKIGLSAALQGRPEARKVIVSGRNAAIKIEPNYTLRGTLFPPTIRGVQPAVEQAFGYAEARIISAAELYGGKLCAALDRQHPRDIFDVEPLLETDTLHPEIIKGFIALLLSHNRPPHELLHPVPKDQSAVFAKEFSGMTDQPYTYRRHNEVFARLVPVIRQGILPYAKAIADFMNLDETTLEHQIPGLRRLPAIQWKLHNLATLKSGNPVKFNQQLASLRALLPHRTLGDTP